jgi:oligopeptide/dipeptide ABC transporter ATP-binding protein
MIVAQRDMEQVEHSAPRGEHAPEDVMLEVFGLTKEYPIGDRLFSKQTLRAVDDVSFSATRGQTLALVGESGSGKSTIGRCLLNLTKTTKGRISFQGQEIQGLSQRSYRPFRKYVQMVFQSPISSFTPGMTVGEALKEPLQLRDDLDKGSYSEQVVELLQHVGLTTRFVDLYPSQMSGGQLQRVGVARALASQPHLVFLDEPTSALDMSIRGQIVNLLLDQQGVLGLGYILVTHDLRVVRFMADRVAVMYLGQFVELGSRTQVFQNPLHPYTRGLFAAVLIGTDQRREQRQSFQLRGEVLRLEKGYQGCRLLKRCRFVRDDCQEEQSLYEYEPGHWVRCWRANEV